MNPHEAIAMGTVHRLVDSILEGMVPSLNIQLCSDPVFNGPRALAKVRLPFDQETSLCLLDKKTGPSGIAVAGPGLDRKATSAKR